MMPSRSALVLCLLLLAAGLTWLLWPAGDVNAGHPQNCGDNTRCWYNWHQDHDRPDPTPVPQRPTTQRPTTQRPNPNNNNPENNNNNDQTDRPNQNNRPTCPAGQRPHGNVCVSNADIDACRAAGNEWVGNRCREMDNSEPENRCSQDGWVWSSAEQRCIDSNNQQAANCAADERWDNTQQRCVSATYSSNIRRCPPGYDWDGWRCRVRDDDDDDDDNNHRPVTQNPVTQNPVTPVVLPTCGANQYYSTVSSQCECRGTTVMAADGLSCSEPPTPTCPAGYLAWPGICVEDPGLPPGICPADRVLNSQGYCPCPAGVSQQPDGTCTVAPVLPVFSPPASTTPTYSTWGGLIFSALHLLTTQGGDDFYLLMDPLTITPPAVGTWSTTVHGVTETTTIYATVSKVTLTAELIVAVDPANVAEVAGMRPGSPGWPRLGTTLSWVLYEDPALPGCVTTPTDVTVQATRTQLTDLIAPATGGGGQWQISAEVEFHVVPPDVCRSTVPPADQQLAPATDTAIDRVSVAVMSALPQ